MSGEQGGKAVHKKVHLFKRKGKECSLCYVAIGYKIPYGTFLAAQPNITCLRAGSLVRVPGKGTFARPMAAPSPKCFSELAQVSRLGG